MNLPCLIAILTLQLPQEARIDSLIRSELARSPAPGLQVAVRHRENGWSEVMDWPTSPANNR